MKALCTLLSATVIAAIALPAKAQLQPKQPTTVPTVQQQLIHAVIQDQIDTVRALLAKGADPNARSVFAAEDRWFADEQPRPDAKPPLIVLACRFRSIKGPDIIQTLIDRGADVNIADKNGVTPLMAASQICGPVSMLIEHKANVNAADTYGKTALMYAMNNLGLNVAAQLLEHGANINARNNQGQSSLILAITNARQNPIMLYGEDLTKKSIEEKAAYLELIQFLVDQHADVSIADKAGNTPMKLATIQKESEVVAILQKAGARQ